MQVSGGDTIFVLPYWNVKLSHKTRRYKTNINFCSAILECKEYSSVGLNIVTREFLFCHIGM